MILSVFPGIDLLGKAFEQEGFCVVRGPDLIWGGRVEEFHCIAGVFEGVIGGSPCQDFSDARRSAETGEGVRMLQEYLRIVTETKPIWFLLENVRRVPDVLCEGYTIQRFDLTALECGLSQRRLRHFQFGYQSLQLGHQYSASLCIWGSDQPGAPTISSGHQNDYPGSTQQALTATTL